MLQRQLATHRIPGQPGDADSRLVTRPLVSDLQITYIVAGSDPAPLLSQAMLDAWNVDSKAIDARALVNLRSRFGSIPHKPVSKLPWLHVVDVEDGYAASRLLLSEQWNTLAQELGGRLVLGVPTRDIVTFTTETDRGRLSQLRATVETIAAAEDGAISRQLFEWTPDGWRPFD